MSKNSSTSWIKFQTKSNCMRRKLNDYKTHQMIKWLRWRFPNFAKNAVSILLWKEFTPEMLFRFADSKF